MGTFLQSFVAYFVFATLFWEFIYGHFFKPVLSFHLRSFILKDAIQPCLILLLVPILIQFTYRSHYVNMGFYFKMYLYTILPQSGHLLEQLLLTFLGRCLSFFLIACLSSSQSCFDLLACFKSSVCPPLSRIDRFTPKQKVEALDCICPVFFGIRKHF